MHFVCLPHAAKMGVRIVVVVVVGERRGFPPAGRINSAELRDAVHQFQSRRLTLSSVCATYQTVSSSSSPHSGGSGPVNEVQRTHIFGIIVCRTSQGNDRRMTNVSQTQVTGLSANLIQFNSI